MTYGWAILIIAVVLGAIYSLGLFNGASLAPRAQPGSCQVIRPNGPWTTQYISLAGACTNELPQYVAQFNGQNSWIITTTTNFPSGSVSSSAFAWIYMPAAPVSTLAAVSDYGTAGGGQLRGLLITPSQNIYFGGYSDDFGSTLNVPVGSWHFVGYSYSTTGSQITVYLDGQSQTIGIGALSTGISSTASIGYDIAEARYLFNGRIADLQIYNNSMDANSVKALYQEGIGGAPVNLQYLAGWWPLNGNANDYSGNVNNGQATNVIYTNQWIGGYTIP